jgi:hypothetical protein
LNLELNFKHLNQAQPEYNEDVFVVDREGYLHIGRLYEREDCDVSDMEEGENTHEWQVGEDYYSPDDFPVWAEIPVLKVLEINQETHSVVTPIENIEKVTFGYKKPEVATGPYKIVGNEIVRE